MRFEELYERRLRWGSLHQMVDVLWCGLSDSMSRKIFLTPNEASPASILFDQSESCVAADSRRLTVPLTPIPGSAAQTLAPIDRHRGGTGRPCAAY